MDIPADPDSPEVFAEDFLHFVLEGNIKFAMNAFAESGLQDASGNVSSRGLMEESLQEFVGGIMTFAGKEVVMEDAVVEGERAMVRFTVQWEGLMADTLAMKTFSGMATVRLRKNIVLGWDIVQAMIPGWNA
jgi:hypothetical protein